MPGPDHASARLVLSPEEERAYEQHDLRRAVWAYLSELRHSADFVKLAAPAASMMRVILALGDEPGDRAAAIAESAVLGGILHGIAPRDGAGWTVAEQHFDEKTLEDLRHWTPIEGWFGHPPGEYCACGCRWRAGEAAPARPRTS
ncbi:MAG: hypothetical protein IPI85_09665 [Dehalococcoidia bacterium]|nr:hypothetical protein [Dehalococcoidia bacterium]